MSIVEKALGKVRIEPVTSRDGGGRASAAVAPATTTQDRGAAVSEVLTGPLFPQRAVRLAAPEQDAITAVWRGTTSAAVSNQFRGLRRELLAALRECLSAGSAPAILVTSPLPGDGKTFVSAAIARMLASAADYRATLIDIDLFRRRCSALFGAQELRGVLDCLTGEADPNVVLCRTDVPRLNFLPAGSRPGDSHDVLLGQRIDELLARLRSSGTHCVNVLDAPPVLPVIETAALAAKVDLVLMIVHAGVTPRAAVAEALAKLGPATNVRLVLNGVRQLAIADYYDYSAYASSQPRN